MTHHNARLHLHLYECWKTTKARSFTSSLLLMNGQRALFFGQIEGVPTSGQD
jgi:hypothetical protein